MKWRRKATVAEDYIKKVKPLSTGELLEDWQWGYNTGSHKCTLSAGQYALGCAVYMPRERYIAFSLGYLVGEREHKKKAVDS